MSYGFKLSVGHGLAPSNCTSWITAKFGPFTVSSALVISTAKVSGQTSVVASLGGNVATLYLVRECGGLKVNSIGFVNFYRPPPSCAGD